MLEGSLIYQEPTWIARYRKFKFQSGPETQYLFVTVIEMEAKQYAKIDMPGLFVMFDGKKPPLLLGLDLLEVDLARKGSLGPSRSLGTCISTSPLSSLFLSSMFKRVYL